MKVRLFSFWRYTLLLICALTAGNAVADGVSERMLQGAMLYIDSLKRDLDTQEITEKRKLYNYLQIAVGYHDQAQDSAIFYTDKGIALAMKLKDYESIMKLYSNLGVTLFFNANYEESYAALERARELAVAHGNKDEESSAVAFMGTAYAKAGKYNTAIDYFLKALKMAEENGHTERGVMALANLSEINRRLGNSEIALSYLKQAEEKSKHLEEFRYRWRIFHIYNEYAFNYLDSDNTDMTLYYALKADSIGKITGGVINICYAKGLLATISLKQNDYDRALEYANESYKEASTLNDKNLYAYAGKILSDVYMAQKNYPEAEAVALKVWESDSTHIDESRDIVENIVRANIRMGNWEKADYFLKKYSELNATYSKRSFQNIVSDLSIKYETEKKEARIGSLEKERQMYIWLGLAGVLLAIALAIVLAQNKRNMRKEQQLIAVKAVQEGEMGERARIAEDLHDRLGGSLAAVKIGLKNADSLQVISDKLDECIKEIREITHNLMPRSLRMSGMKKALEDITADLPKVHFYFFGEEKRITDSMEYTVYCCAKELVNNALKHSGAININLQLVQSEKHVSLTVQDDGCGFDEKTVIKGNGLENIRNRIATCKGKLDIISSLGKGTETIVELIIDS